jgi:hypothetical protein
MPKLPCWLFVKLPALVVPRGLVAVRLFFNHAQGRDRKKADTRRKARGERFFGLEGPPSRTG